LGFTAKPNLKRTNRTDRAFSNCGFIAVAENRLVKPTSLFFIGRID
jgi:hypothetical protein